MSGGWPTASNGMCSVPGPDTPRAFADPAIDAIVAMMLELAQECWVTRARLAALEAQFGPAPRLSDAAEAALAQERAAFVARVLGPIERV